MAEQMTATPDAGDVNEAYSPAWWLKRLAKKLAGYKPSIQLADDYYAGRHRMLFATEKFRKEFGDLFSERFADNWCGLVVDALEERLNPEGFRIPDGTEPKRRMLGLLPPRPSTETAADTEAWDIWQRNQLDLYSQIAHLESLIKRESFALVWFDGESERAKITIEDATQMVVDYEPGTYGRVVRAGLKVWQDDDEFLMATLYLADGIYKFRSKGKHTEGGGEIKWEPRVEGEESWPVKNPFSRILIVPLHNRPRLLSVAQSELAQVIPMQDAVNKLVIDMLVASEYAGFPQRWVTGIQIPVDPETKQPLPEGPFGGKWAVDRLLATSKENAKFGEFNVADLGHYAKAIELLVQHVASQTRTPPHYFYLSGQFPSGESIKSAETGLVAKARRRMRVFGEAWEEVIRLAFLVEGNPKSEAYNAETIWADPESRSEGEHIDALLKKKALNVPELQLFEDAGYTPQQIERFPALREQFPPPAPQQLPPTEGG